MTRAEHLHKTLVNIVAVGDDHAPAATRLVKILNIAEGALEKDREEFLQPRQQDVAQAHTQDG